MDRVGPVGYLASVLDMNLTRRIAALIAFALLGLTGCDGAANSAAGAAGGPRALLLITVDGLRPSELALYGGAIETPNLTAIADAGRAWSDTWTVAPMTRPAVATYLTGIAPDRHGIRDDMIGSLPAEIPTLAERLADVGYATVAFPDSSFLGPASGLHRGFDMVDDAPPDMPGPMTWLPVVKRPLKMAEEFEAWAETLADDAKVFAWVHLSLPMAAQLLESTEDPPPGAPEQEPFEPIAKVDEAVGRMVQALGAKVPTGDTAILIAGTVADVGPGDAERMVGPGFSLGEAALVVPVIARFPSSSGKARVATGPVWAPDVPVTLASLAGVSLTGSEGTSLLTEAADDRLRFAWSWATRDQMGWRSLRAVKRGRLVHHDGLERRTVDLTDGRTLEAADPRATELAEALALRAEPPSAAVPLDPVRPLFEARNMKLDPVPVAGRDFGPAATRVEISAKIWHARRLMRLGAPPEAVQAYERVIELDPKNLAGRLSLGQYLSFRSPTALEVLEPAVLLYPAEPEILHWWGHAIWAKSPKAWKDAELLLQAILPFMPHNGDVLYDLACTRSLAEDVDASAGFLRRSIVAGYRQWEHIETDSDLRNLRKSGRFAEVLQEFRR